MLWRPIGWLLCMVAFACLAIIFYRTGTLHRIAKFRVIALILGFSCAIVLAEGMAALFFLSDQRGFATMRKYLSGEFSAVAQASRCSAQPYLVAVPTPGFHEDPLDRELSPGKVFHNKQGYRGKAVSMERTPGFVRVLCLGGSTTYGWGTSAMGSSYPAQLEQIITEDLPPEVRGIEVINGGLPWGTTAEMLTHYHFKFQYFRPDLTIINTGGNDAIASAGLYYQPDYSHWRRPLQAPRFVRASPGLFE